MGLRAGLLSLGLAVAAGAGAEVNPHRFLSDRGHCLDCHQEVPQRGAPLAKLRFKKDIVSLCLDCHREKDVSALHPVDIRPGARVAPQLPLDERGAITCATCHSVHGPHEATEPYVAEALSKRLLSVFSPKKKHRTFFLRRRNDEGQLCLACHQRNLLAAEPFHSTEASVLDQYVGSGACKACHAETHKAWEKTPHARMVGDARKNPAVILADFDKGAPFSRDKVVYTLGAHWSQRFVVEKAGRLFVKGAVWSIGQKVWETSSNVDKPWAEYCQGCHTTGFEMRDAPRFAELGIGCEACHGPGRAHVQAKGRGPIVNPAELSEQQRDMICESCHTTGHDRTGQFRFPLGFRPGKDLTRYFKGLLPKPGQDNASFDGDESYNDRHRQWLFWTRGFLDVRDVTCDICKNFRGKVAQTKEKVQMSPSEHCLSCHRESLPASDGHRRHLEAGVPCLECHSPTPAAGGPKYSIHDHKFLFSVPEKPRSVSPGETCKGCHRKTVSRAVPARLDARSLLADSPSRR